MASTPYLLQLPALDAAPARSLVNGVANLAINAESSADAIAYAKTLHGADVDSLWDSASATVVAAAVNLSGWKFRVRVFGAFALGASAIPKFDGTVTADGTTAGFIAAAQTLTNDGVNVSNGDTVTVDAKVYTFQTALTNVDGNVFIGGSNTASMTNLFNAINLGAGSGTAYAAATTLHPTVLATNPTGTTVVVTAKVPGSVQNAIVTTETSTHLAFGAATLAGGVGAVDKLSGLARKMVTALNASTATSGIANAAFNDTTHVLTVAGAGDTLGDQRILYSFYGPNADSIAQITIPGFVSAKADAGAAGAALTMTLAADSYTVPTVVAQLGSLVT